MSYEINHSISEYKGWSVAAYDFSKGMNIAIGNFKDVLTTANEISEENTKLQDRISELEESIDTLQKELSESDTENNNRIMSLKLNYSMESSRNKELEKKLSVAREALEKFVARTEPYWHYVEDRRLFDIASKALEKIKGEK